ncbi:MAG TPA: fatty acid desaturase [Polyangiaceae bacterium]|nr:fatty acid desaturase [Polyangiaceae bacterium]
MQSPGAPMREPSELCWTNICFLIFAHVLAGVGVWWSMTHFNAWTLLLGFSWFVFCGLSITAGYHRLFAHRTYDAVPWLRLLVLCFGAASAQNSALHWANHHRIHHSKVDREEDPYNIHRGFFWAHIGWVLFEDSDDEFRRVRDLRADTLVMWQHRHYVALGIAAGALLPAAVGALWGDALGGLLIGGFVRVVFQYHMTFATNSVAHTLGARPYDRSISARDHFLTAVLTLGEGYHNFHHRFQNDYRNGVRRWDFDPTKWLIWTLSQLGAAHNLKRVPEEKIQRALRLALEDAPPEPTSLESA